MCMKIAVSIPDTLFEAADQLAQQRGVPRSQVYAEALRDYLASQGPEAITARLDELYALEGSRVESAWLHAQAHPLADEAW